MQVKTFKAPTMALALEQIKRELGPDAIILGNKQVGGSALESMFEVTAAKDDDYSRPQVSTPGKDKSGIPESSSVEPPGVAGEQDIRDELLEIKSFLSLLISNKDSMNRFKLEEPIAELFHGLLARGFDEKLTYILLSKAVSSMSNVPTDKGEILEAFCRQLLERVKLSRPFQHLGAARGLPHTFTFLGPTGVGKTTTLAKIAAYLKIKRHMEIGLISIDTYRIGAVDQLQTYAEILDVPMIVARNKAEFDHARDHFRHHDIVLVDTTGKNFLDKRHVSDLAPVFGDEADLHHFLVLGATAKDEDLRQTISHFRSIGLHSLIFTKLDETMSHGSIVNQLLRFPYPLSYLGTGQRVPEDIEQATSRRLLTFLRPSRY